MLPDGARVNGLSERRRSAAMSSRTESGSPEMKSKAAQAFVIEGELSVVNATTVICLRRAVSAQPRVLQCSRFDGMGGAMLKDRQEVAFRSGWQVLMGQAEVKNWMRSEPDSTTTMRYGGEYKFAGGTVDEGEDIAAAGARELEEEFLTDVGLALPPDANIRPFVVKQTMPVRSKSNLMYNFVALASENPWLASLDIDGVNVALEERRARHARLVETGEFWKMSVAEKEAVAPEVHRLQWVDLADAFAMTLSTMNNAVEFVDDFQQAEFARYGIKRRDPMFMTAVTLFELEAFPDEASLLEEIDGTDLDQLAAEVQWLFTGMTEEDLQGARQTADGGEPAQMIKDIDEVEALYDRRAGQAKL